MDTSYEYVLLMGIAGLVPKHGNDQGEIDGGVGTTEEGTGKACKPEKNDKA